MAIRPIVGKLRKRLITDISVALGLGSVAGYSYWYGVAVPRTRDRDAFYRRLEEQKKLVAA